MGGRGLLAACAGVIVVLLGLAWWLGEGGGAVVSDPADRSSRGDQPVQLHPEPSGAPERTVHEVEALVGYGRVAKDTTGTIDATPIDLDAPPVGSLLVRARFEDGRPAEGVVIRAMTQSPGRSVDYAMRTERTDHQGEARFDALRCGDVGAYGDRGGAVTGRIEPGEQAELELVIPAGRLVRGQVVDLQGDPVEGADIWLSAAANHTEGAVVTQADRSGYFAIEAVGSWHQVGAIRPPDSPSALHRLDDDADADALITLTLGPAGAELRGRVVDAQGAPVSDARVVVGWENGFRAPPGARGERTPAVTGFSAADGRFAFQALPIGTTSVLCRATGYAAATRSVHLSATAPAEVELSLPPGCEVHGVVTDEQGRPMAGASVMWGDWASHLGRDGVTDAFGRYLLDGLAAGQSSVAVEHHECRAVVTAEVQLTPERPTPCDLVLQRGASLAGKVWDAMRDEPVPDWLVVAHNTDEDESRGHSDMTDVEGGFVLPGLGAGPFHLRVYDPQGARLQPVVERRDVALGDGPIKLLVTTRGQESGAFSACLLDAQGQSPTSGRLLLKRTDGAPWKIELSLGDDGCATIDELMPGEYSLRAIVPGTGGLAPVPLQIAPGRTTDLGVLRLLAGGRVRVEIAAAPDVPLDKLALFIEAADGARAHIPRDGLKALSPPVAAGPGTLTLSGKGVAITLVPVLIEQGGVAFAQVEVRAGVGQRIDLRWSGGEQLRHQYSWTLKALGGQVVSQWLAQVVFGGTARHVVSLAPGSYELKVWSGDGAERNVPFTVVDLVKPETLVIDMD
ncbi:MAG: hypothetical protein DRQ55_14530 [Planctomycetota bacterium]|nr:MAG: hypothetical protein DRQ55_14530 [Planctomycetota bacterium]